ncbi:MAG: DUF2851 family protein [Candidatus Abyssubacteria bacterium]
MPFSEDYFTLFDNVPAFHDKVAQKYLLASQTAQISERLLRCIWFDRLYDEQKLQSRDGSPILVHSPGTWNLESGPDFKNAELTIGAHRLKGDVELHLEPAGWRLHGHAKDPRYDNVILHVVLKERVKGEPPLSRHGIEIPEVALWNCLTDDLKVLKCALRPDEYPYKSLHNVGRCQALLERLPATAASKLLNLAGDARIIAKQRRFGYEAEKLHPNQIAYSALLEGLGYKAFTRQFSQLAQKLPYDRLRTYALSASPPDRPLLTQALLLGAAGLLHRSGNETPPESREYLDRLRGLWREHAHENSHEPEIIWKSAAARPANRPERRIAGASHILARSFEAGLFDSIISRVVNDETKKARNGSIEFLSHINDEFWSRRYTASGKLLNEAVSLVGKGRALTIIVNAFVPLGLLHARTHARPDDEERAHQVFCSLPASLDNSVTRLMEYRMFGPQSRTRPTRTARTQQGLLQVFADWCSEDPSCENCGILAGLQTGFIRDKITSP